MPEEMSHEETEQIMQRLNLILRRHGVDFDDAPRWTWIADDVGGEGG